MANFVNVDDTLREIGGGEPAGPNCEYDPDFAELDRKAAGQPERRMGDIVQAAIPPDWREVQEAAVALLSRTKDIRVAQHLCRALLGRHGLPGLAQGLDLFHRLLESFWPTLHPQLDPDDDNDPTMRVNIIAGLADNDLMLGLIRNSVVVAARSVGRFTLRDVLSANAPGRAPDAPDAGLIAAAFADCDLQELRATATAATDARKRVLQIESLVTDQIGASRAPDLAQLATLLRDAATALAARLAERAGDGTADSGEAEPSSPSFRSAGSAAASAAAGTARVAAPGQVASREDVIRAIDSICTYYEAAEPASPVPQVLRRARRLVGLNFLDLLRDLTPDAVSQFETISGRSREE